MATAAEIRAENERMARQINELLSSNTSLQREMMQLNTERDILEAAGQEKASSLSHELQTVDEELESLRSQCQSMAEVLNTQAQNEVEDDEPAPLPRSRKLSTAFSQTFQRARGMSMPRPRRSSTVQMVAHGLNKAASYVAPSSARSIPSPKSQHRPTMELHKSSPQILSYAKGTTDAKKSLLNSTHSHYGNFRRHSGPYRKNRETVVL
ncbi:hypothetical protein BBJ28_00010075 [Nothophytophthora sp. Chile5]|nr:hypothetical protein BBJ28_00010075 [Nothophytophthora sp. Chile5]